MSTPGGPGDPSQQHYRIDPITGEQIRDGAQPGYQSGMQYQGFGMFEQHNQAPRPQPQPSKSRGPLIAGIATAAVVVIALVTTIVVIATGESEDEAGPILRPEPTAIEPPPPSTSESEPSGSEVQEFVDPTIPGWTGVSWPGFDMAYDVPPGWTPKPGSISGVENSAGERETLSAYSVFMEDACPDSPGSFRAKIGATVGEGGNPTQSATTMIESWSRLGFAGDGAAPPPVRFNPPQPVRVGNIDATLVGGTLTPAPGSECPAPEVYLAALAFPVKDPAKSGMLFAVADQGVPGAVPPPVVDDMLRTFRRP